MNISQPKLRNSEITVIVGEKKKGKKSKWNPHIFCLFVTHNYKSNFEVIIQLFARA